MSVDDKEILGRSPDDGKLLYRRHEGYKLRPGLGIMWDSVSRGFVLMVGKIYLWCRWSMRTKKLNVRCGKIRREEFGHETINLVDGMTYKDGKWQSLT